VKGSTFGEVRQKRGKIYHAIKTLRARAEVGTDSCTIKDRGIEKAEEGIKE